MLGRDWYVTPIPLTLKFEGDREIKGFINGCVHTLNILGLSFKHSASIVNIRHLRVLLRTEISEGNAVRSELSAIVFESQVDATLRPDLQAE